MVHVNIGSEFDCCKGFVTHGLYLISLVSCGVVQ